MGRRDKTLARRSAKALVALDAGGLALITDLGDVPTLFGAFTTLAGLLAIAAGLGVTPASFGACVGPAGPSVGARGAGRKLASFCIPRTPVRITGRLSLGRDPNKVRSRTGESLWCPISGAPRHCLAAFRISERRSRSRVGSAAIGARLGGVVALGIPMARTGSATIRGRGGQVRADFRGWTVLLTLPSSLGDRPGGVRTSAGFVCAFLASFCTEARLSANRGRVGAGTRRRPVSSSSRREARARGVLPCAEDYRTVRALCGVLLADTRVRVA